MRNQRTTYQSRGRVAALLTMPLILAAGVSASRLVPQAMTMDGYPVPGAPAIVTVISAGAEPKTKLRYTVANDYKARVAMNTQMGMTMSMEGMSMPATQMPPMTMSLNVSVTNISATGDISYDVAFTGMSADSSAGADPAMVAALQGLDADYKTIHGAAVISDRGMPRSSNYDFTKITSPALKQMIGSLAGSVENLSMPFPEEPMGVGASWEVRQGMTVSGLQSYQKTLFQVVAIDGKAVTLKTVTSQTAPSQAVHNPDLPPGAEAFLQKLSGSGSGTMTLRLDALIPTSDATYQSSSTMEIRVGGASQIVNVETTMKIAISPVK